MFERMDDVCSWAQNAGLAGTRDFFTWRPMPGAGAALLGRCCTRRKLSLPFRLLQRLLMERRLPIADLQQVDGFEKCGPWDGRQATEGSLDEMQLVPGGVIVVPASDVIALHIMPPATTAFSALLSRDELLVLGSNDYRERCLELLERARECQLQS